MSGRAQPKAARRGASNPPRTPARDPRLARHGHRGGFSAATLEVSADRVWAFSAALADIAEGARAVRVWGRLGWLDVRLSYRRSTLGPLWKIISRALWVVLLAWVYGTLFDAEPARYVPYVAFGVIVFGLIRDLLDDGCMAFLRARRAILEVSMPLSVHVYRVVWRNLVVFLHNGLILAAVALAYDVRPFAAGLTALLGLVVIAVNAVWVGLLLGALSARFRDVPSLVASLGRLAFFVTPIIWTVDRLPSRAVFVDFNPFHHMLQLVRAPLLGAPAPALSWIAALCVTAIGWPLAVLAFARCRSRVPYWL